MVQPKYSTGQRVKIMHTWAQTLPAKVVSNAKWDESWGCYTYALEGCALRIEEHELAAYASDETIEKSIAPH